MIDVWMIGKDSHRDFTEDHRLPDHQYDLVVRDTVFGPVELRNQGAPRWSSGGVPA